MGTSLIVEAKVAAHLANMVQLLKLSTQLQQLHHQFSPEMIRKHCKCCDYAVIMPIDE